MRVSGSRKRGKMELKYVVMTIIKILISVPTAMLLASKDVSGAALMGGHLDNKNSTTIDKSLLTDYELYDDQELGGNFTQMRTNESQPRTPSNQENQQYDSEEIPDPSPLVAPGYNLPENIFNRGKPFYLERDPLTGTVNFDSKPSLSDVEEDQYEYEDDRARTDMFDKDNIDRKDSNFGSHKSSDVNQLVPNFHDYLNLPVKYNSDKYVYPLISSSYANTKVQGNVNKHQNHKNYVSTTATSTPAFYYSKTYQPKTERTTQVTTTTTTTTERPKPMVTFQSTRVPSLLDDVMGYEGIVTQDDVHSSSTEANRQWFTKEVSPTPLVTHRSTTKRTVDSISLTTTTKKPLSLFQQLFGDYEETETDVPSRPFVTATTEKVYAPSGGATPEYEYEYEDEPSMDIKKEEVQKNVVNSYTTLLPTFHPSSSSSFSYNSPHSTPVTHLPETTTEYRTTTTTTTTARPTPTSQKQTIYNSEKVIYQNSPSTTIHIAPDQNTASFLVRNHHGEFVGSVVEENGYHRPSTPQQHFSGSSVTIQPLKHSEASLAIGVPMDRVKVVPGKVMDEKLEVHAENSGSRVVFPDEKQPSYTAELLPPREPNREILKLSSKPMFHQLPSSLTPPKESIEQQVPSKFYERPRPPWDPRPDRFHSGRPEYLRPPSRQPQFDSNKRVDNLPNILPFVRTNTKTPPLQQQQQHHESKSYARLPLLDRQSNRPVGFFEKLQPPPPPPPKYLAALRKVPLMEHEKLKHLDERHSPVKKAPSVDYFQTPPSAIVPTRRRVGEGAEVETLQMIQAKQLEKQEEAETEATVVEENEASTEKTLYVVYPVNTAPLKLDAFDAPKKESVVIGTRAELPLPPSKIHFEQGSLFNPKDRSDSPILRPHVKPQYTSVKSDFPYPLEKPEPALNSVDNSNIESRIVTGANKNDNRISVTLRTYTEKPIAVAYSPTEKFSDRYSVPNYAGPVIPEIRPGSMGSLDIGSENNSEFTLGAVMSHRVDTIETTRVPAQDFEAPFQASANVDSAPEGWSVVGERAKAEERLPEATTVAQGTTREFDIENFKPQLIGGFVPIYDFKDEKEKDRRER